MMQKQHNKGKKQQNERYKNWNYLELVGLLCQISPLYSFCLACPFQHDGNQYPYTTNLQYRLSEVNKIHKQEQIYNFAIVKLHMFQW